MLSTLRYNFIKLLLGSDFVCLKDDKLVLVYNKDSNFLGVSVDISALKTEGDLSPFVTILVRGLKTALSDLARKEEED